MLSVNFGNSNPNNSSQLVRVLPDNHRSHEHLKRYSEPPQRIQAHPQSYSSHLFLQWSLSQLKITSHAQVANETLQRRTQDRLQNSIWGRTKHRNLWQTVIDRLLVRAGTARISSRTNWKDGHDWGQCLIWYHWAQQSWVGYYPSQNWSK
jgi:hypothetical protein